MGFIDDAKEVAETAGRKVKETFEDATDRIGDKVDEAKADANVKKAEAERDSVATRTEITEDLRGHKCRGDGERPRSHLRGRLSFRPLRSARMPWTARRARGSEAPCRSHSCRR